MSKPFGFRGIESVGLRNQAKQIRIIAKESNVLVFAVALAIFAFLISLWNSQTTSFAHAYAGANLVQVAKSSSPLFEKENALFENKNTFNKQVLAVEPGKTESKGKDSASKTAKLIAKPQTEVAEPKANLFENQNKLVISEDATGKDKLGIVGLGLNQKRTDGSKISREFAEKLYGIVGETPIKEMVPFIAQRDEKVAAFLVGIAKKESSFGLASPSKDGETCYNYWGYKSSGERGTALGYACFASAEEAIKTVGDRIEVLVNKERNTPARMVDTWKCGRSCAGDPGAPGWTSTVALYFNQIVENKG